MVTACGEAYVPKVEVLFFIKNVSVALGRVSWGFWSEKCHILTLKNYLDFEGFNRQKKLKQDWERRETTPFHPVPLHPNCISGPCTFGTSVPPSLAFLRRCKPIHLIAVMSWDLETHSSKAGHEPYSWCPSWLHKNKEEDLWVTAQAWETLKGNTNPEWKKTRWKIWSIPSRWRGKCRGWRLHEGGRGSRWLPWRTRALSEEVTATEVQPWDRVSHKAPQVSLWCKYKQKSYYWWLWKY